MKINVPPTMTEARQKFLNEKLGPKKEVSVTKSKSEINAEYKAELSAHKSKTWSSNPRAFVFGYKPDNIGGEIHKRLSGLIECDFSDYLYINLPQLPDYIYDYDAFVFNNAVNHLDWIENWNDDLIDYVISNTLTATMKSVAKIAAVRLKTDKRTKIVIIGSMAHKSVLNGSAPYCAAKAGLQHFVRCVAYELAPKGIEVFCVNPTNVQDSPMSEATIVGLAKYRNISYEEAKAYWGNECPMGEFLTKGEIAEIVDDLICNDRRYLSGSAIDLIGGQR